MSILNSPQLQLPVVGTLIEKVKQLDFENARKIGDFDVEAQKERKKRTESENGDAKAVQNLQEIHRDKHVRSKLGLDKS